MGESATERVGRKGRKDKGSDSRGEEGSEVQVFSLPSQTQSGNRNRMTIGGAGPFNLVHDVSRTGYENGVQFRGYTWSTEYNRETIHVATVTEELIQRKMKAPGFILLPNLPNNIYHGQLSPQEKEQRREDMTLELKCESQPMGPFRYAHC